MRAFVRLPFAVLLWATVVVAVAAHLKGRRAKIGRLRRRLCSRYLVPLGGLCASLARQPRRKPANKCAAPHNGAPHTCARKPMQARNNKSKAPKTTDLSRRPLSDDWAELDCGGDADDAAADDDVKRRQTDTLLVVESILLPSNRHRHCYVTLSHTPLSSHKMVARRKFCQPSTASLGARFRLRGRFSI